MKDAMSEPISGTAAGAFGWKLIGGLAGMGAIGAALATIVVMCMTRPQNDREWTVAIISTVMSSFAGGSAFVMHFEIQHWAQSAFGLVALIGVVFTCGLPGWAIVRWLFNGIAKRDAKGADLLDVVKDVKESI
jgi:hypothetical protein